MNSISNMTFVFEPFDINVDPSACILLLQYTLFLISNQVAKGLTLKMV